MSFQTLSRNILKRHNETYILQKKVIYIEDTVDQKLKDEVGNIIEKDEIGNIKDTWEDLQVLSGVIQHRQYEKQRNRVLSITEAGEESTVRYYGYFDPTFSLKTDALADYRVKFIRDYETLYLKILEYDPNNYLRNDHHHIVLGMERDRKYEGRQRGKKTPNITLDAPDSILEGEEAILTLTFPDDAVGDVIINDRYRMIIENGTISTPILDLLLGKNIVTVKFLGDSQYNDVILTHEILVKDNINIVVPNNITKYYSGPERLPITILNANNEPIGNMEVFIELNGVKYRRMTKTEDGSSSIPLNIQPGIYEAHITVGDKVTQCNITVLNTISHDKNKIFNSSKRYFAIFFDGKGNFLPKNTTIQFEVNGVRYSRKVSTDDGVAFLGGNLPEGDYTITSFNTVTLEHLSNNITIKRDGNIVVHASDMTLFINERTSKTYDFTVTNNVGDPILDEPTQVTLCQSKPFFKEVFKKDTNSDGKVSIRLNNCTRTGVYTLTIQVRDIIVEHIITVLDNY